VACFFALGSLHSTQSSDYDIFFQPGFDANDYANAVLAGETYSTQQAKKPAAKSYKTATGEPAKEDISLVLAKLNIGIDDVAKQLRTVVSCFCWLPVLKNDSLMRVSLVNLLGNESS
jgi:hypothetical protein